ncbi:MAG: Asparagine synthetase 1 [Verrucomicrobiota bacterium]|jgi:asparagine synthase (glutamine-hydrolysing)
MCAIFGFAGFRAPSLLDKMETALRHRGPDGEGRLEDPRHLFSMGMCRLSIIDLHGGDQPICNEKGTLAICYNGEVYNYVELRAELEQRGHIFKTRTDTETILHAYEEWGEGCLARLNGMFAFAIHDAESGETFFARDRCGQKPFYYHRAGRHFVFASEIKALLRCSLVPRACNLAAIDPYLALRYVPEPQTMFEGIFTLPAAHCARLTADGGFSLRRYWDIDTGRPRRSADWESETESLLHDAVRLTMRSDVPVAGYLSAGVDSSLLVALMTQFSSRVNTYSIGFGAPGDETPAAAETARLLGTNHHEIICRPEDLAQLPRVVYQMDRPVGDALIVAFDKLAQGASRDTKVVISGEGADEVFAGYSFHNVIQLAEAYHSTVPAFVHDRAAMPLLRGLPVDFLNRFFVFPAKLGHEGKARLVDFMGGYRNRNIFSNYIALKTLWPHDQRSALYTREFKHRATDAWVPAVRGGGGCFLDRLLKLQWDEWLQDWCIIRQDKNAMAHSLEVRLPFLDHRLIELGFELPAALKNNGFRDKILERRIASRLLPTTVTRRKKNPFFLPMDFFFEHGAISELIDDTLGEASLLRRGYFEPAYVAALRRRMQGREFVHLKQVMSLVILELWHRIFIDGDGCPL